MKQTPPSDGVVPRVRFGLRQQAALGGTLLVVGLAAATALALYHQWQLAQSARQAIDLDAPAAAVAYDVAISAARCRRLDGEFEHSLDQPRARGDALASWQAACQGLERNLARMGALYADRPGQAPVDRWQRDAQRYAEGFLAAAGQAQHGGAARADTWHGLDAVRRHIEAVNGEAESFAAARMNDAAASGRRLQETIARRVRLLNARAVVALLVLILCWLWFHRAVLARVRVLGEAIHRFAAGDWKVRLESNGNDELDLLARQCNAMAAAVRASHEQLDRARAAAQAASRAKSEFLASVSEEIRRPVKVSQGYTEMLLGALKSTENLEAAGAIKRNNEYVLEVLDDLRDLSQIEAGRLRVEFAPCSPQRIVAEVASATRVRADAKGLSLEADFEGPVPEQIVTDPNRVRQILLNLVGNAIKFTELGTIRLATRLLDADGQPQIRFQVIDPGIGMTPQQMARIFHPLSPDDARSEDGLPATGLGLTLCKQLAEMLGGALEADSTPGCGSTFTLTIPTGPLRGVRMVRASSEAVQEHEERAAAPKPATKLDCRILLAEDGRENRRLISFVLHKAGAKVEMAEDGQEAVAKMREATAAAQAGRDEGAFDLVLMDMQMPVLDGYDAARRLRQEGFQGPIIAITGHTRDYDRQRCVEAGCNDYLPKPVDREALLAMVARYALASGASRVET